MKKQFLMVLALGVSISFATGTVQAELIGRDNGMVYDSTHDLTWLQDANYAVTSGYDIDGLMTWDEAMTWAQNLTHGGYDDWRLPSVSNPEFPGSGEFSYLYAYGIDCYRYNDWSTDRSGPFDNMPSHVGYYDSVSYWTNYQTGEQTALTYSFEGAGFWANYYSGNQKTALVRVWAVRDGDVAPVPVPPAIFLLGSGILGITGLRRIFSWRTL
jgi:hypothetical protein